MTDADDLAPRVEQLEAAVETLERELEDVTGGLDGRVSELEDRLETLGRPMRRVRRRRGPRESTDGE